MKTNNIFFITVALCVILVVAYVLKSASRYEDNVEEIHEHWKEYEEFLLTSPDSPIGNTKAFEGIRYFEPDINYTVSAKVEKINSNKVINLITNDGEERSYTKFALLHFSLLGQKHELTLLQNQLDKSDFFLPFKDLTNGNETYGAGRYMPIELVSLKSIELDFNLAMNPYCAYNATYSCPIPPTENFINTRIEAGQKYIHKLK